LYKGGRGRGRRRGRGRGREKKMTARLLAGFGTICVLGNKVVM